MIVDNYATHKHAKVKAWLARRPRFHVRFTPTYASWLNPVERWFGIVAQQAIRRGSFSKVKTLIQRIEASAARPKRSRAGAAAAGSSRSPRSGRGTGHPQDVYRPAVGENALVRAAVDAMIAGDPLAAEAEQTLTANGWETR